MYNVQYIYVSTCVSKKSFKNNLKYFFLYIYNLNLGCYFSEKKARKKNNNKKTSNSYLNRKPGVKCWYLRFQIHKFKYLSNLVQHSQ